MTRDEEHLRLLAIFHYVVAGITGLFSLFPILHLVVGLAMVTGEIGPWHPGSAARRGEGLGDPGA